MAAANSGFENMTSFVTVQPKRNKCCKNNNKNNDDNFNIEILKSR